MDFAWEDLLSRTKACKSNLQKWNKVVFRRANGEIAALKGQLNVLLNQPNALREWRRIKEIQDQIKVLWKREEIYWCQRSRVKWLNWGGP